MRLYFISWYVILFIVTFTPQVTNDEIYLDLMAEPTTIRMRLQTFTTVRWWEFPNVEVSVKLYNMSDMNDYVLDWRLHLKQGDRNQRSYQEKLLNYPWSGVMWYAVGMTFTISPRPLEVTHVKVYFKLKSRVYRGSFVANVTSFGEYDRFYFVDFLCAEQCLHPTGNCDVCFTERCPHGFWGLPVLGNFLDSRRCSRLCYCKHDAACHGVTGHCPRHQCRRGAFFDAKFFNCIYTCRLGIFGVKSAISNVLQCTGVCRCLNVLKCNIRSGRCRSGGCRAGYGGTTCQEPCFNGTFGRNCRKICHCQPNSTCHRFTGSCSRGCHLRYYGRNCQKVCPGNKFLVNRVCKGDCHCSSADNCRVTDGMCKGFCMDGWRGQNCQEKCPAYTFGSKCRQSCHCAENQSCHHLTGQCESGCDLRFYGKQCQNECKSGTYLINGKCTGVCHCRDAAYCAVISGLCMRGGCEPGLDCRTGCPGRYGIDCTHRCHCQKSFPCDPLSGACPSGCHHRYFGRSCEKTCRQDLFVDAVRKTCFKICHCNDTSACRVNDGHCLDGVCAAGWMGQSCQHKCPFGRYGISCRQECGCISETAKSCDRVTGTCEGHCKIRFYGKSCRETCERGFFVQNGTCSGRCNCLMVNHCNVTNGSCGRHGCVLGWKGPTCHTECVKTFGRTCQHQCHCKDGIQCDYRDGYCSNGCLTRYTLWNCSKTCPDGFYGQKCTNLCRCQNAHRCLVSTGVCTDGYCKSNRRYGPTCNRKCSDGRFLINGSCIGDCHCQHPTQCLVKNGRCLRQRCSAGYMGWNCQQKCPRGKFGRNCLKTCHCRFNDVCDYQYGECPRGCDDKYTGSNCQETTDMFSFGLTVGSWTLAILISVIIGTGLGYLKLIADHKRSDYSVSDVSPEGETATEQPKTIVEEESNAVQEGAASSTALHAETRSLWAIFKSAFLPHEEEPISQYKVADERSDDISPSAITFDALSVFLTSIDSGMNVVDDRDSESSLKRISRLKDSQKHAGSQTSYLEQSSDSKRNRLFNTVSQCGTGSGNTLISSIADLPQIPELPHDKKKSIKRLSRRKDSQQHADSQTSYLEQNSDSKRNQLFNAVSQCGTRSGNTQISSIADLPLIPELPRDKKRSIKRISRRKEGQQHTDSHTSYSEQSSDSKRNQLFNTFSPPATGEANTTLGRIADLPEIPELPRDTKQSKKQKRKDKKK